MTFSLENFFHLFNEHSRKIATGVNILLIVFMSLTVAKAVLWVMEISNNAPVDRTAMRPAETAEDKTTYKVSNLELFGKLKEATATPQIIDAPETKLNLELQGVFISENEKFSTAIIGERNKTGELYAIGDRLPGNATLASVLVDHVLIRRGARMEKLMFSDSKFRITKSSSNNRSAANASPGKAFPGTDTTRSDLERIRDRIRDAPSGGRGADSPSPSVTTSIDAYRQKLKNDPASALSQAGISPVTEGETKGYRVGADAQSAIKQAGLQPGDVIVSVNGRAVGNMTNDSALIDQVMASSRVRVEVKRGTRRFFLTVPVPK